MAGDATQGAVGKASSPQPELPVSWNLTRHLVCLRGPAAQGHHLAQPSCLFSDLACWGRG